MTKELKNPYASFIGGNSQNVTGSCNMVRFKNYTILVDCGMVQTNCDASDYKINSTRHKDIKPKHLDGIIVTHATHCDHAFLIPSLYRDGATCPLYIPKGSKGILTLMLQDSVKIFNQEYEKHKRKPIYTQEDVDKTLQHIIECDIHSKIKINDAISFTYYSAEHIPKARQIVLELNNGVNTKKIGFTGDISNKFSQYYINDFEPITDYLDVLVGECTYSNDKRLHKKCDKAKDIDKLKMAINYAVSHKSKVLIPTFANARLQEVLTTIYDIYNGKPPIRILIHTPLGKSICNEWGNVIDKNHDLWKDVMAWDKKIFIDEPKDVEFYAKQQDFPLLILASGGFLKSGSGMAWIKYILPNPKDYIVFCGYASEESNAGKIKSGKVKEIKIDKSVVKNKCKFINLVSFSSHMDREQLLEYYSSINCGKICLVHSEQDSKIVFAKDLRDRLSALDKTTKVIATNYETKVHF